MVPASLVPWTLIGLTQFCLSRAQEGQSWALLEWLRIVGQDLQ